MRLLFVIPHYVNPPETRFELDGKPATTIPTLSHMAKVAALGDTLAALVSHFGARRHRLEGMPVSVPHSADVIVVTQDGSNVLPFLDYAAAITEVVTVPGDPRMLPWHCHDMLRARHGDYDYYCYLEDDIIIHDPAFFEKLAWFQQAFGPHALLQPVAFELSRTGVPAKVVKDPSLNETLGRVFRRSGQRQRLTQTWMGRAIDFEIPGNPHSGAFFLSARQCEIYIAHKSFGDRDTSWVGPMESAATHSIGKVFDLYKAVEPNLFFIEVEHYGTRYAAQFAPFDIRYGDEPLLAIAEEALRALSRPAAADSEATQRLMLAARTVGGSVARQAIEERALGVIAAHRHEYAAERDRALVDLAAERGARAQLEQSPRLLLRALVTALAKRIGLAR